MPGADNAGSRRPAPQPRRLIKAPVPSASRPALPEPHSRPPGARCWVSEGTATGRSQQRSGQPEPAAVVPLRQAPAVPPAMGL